MDLRFDDHPSFHRAAVGMVGGAAAFGFALHPVMHLAPLVGGVFGIAAGAAWAYKKPLWRFAGAAAAIAPLTVTEPTWPVLALGAAALGFTLAIGAISGKKRALKGATLAMFGGTIALLGMWVASRIFGAAKTHEWSGWTRDVAASSAMGIVGVLAMLPRHVRASIDPVRAAHKKLPTNLDAEVRGLCDRSVAIWAAAKDKNELLRDGVLKTLEVAAKSSRVEATSGPADADLAARAADLDQRIAAATDDEVKQQYTSARAALEDQRKYREKIRASRERMVARLHNHVAALEKFQLAASGLEATAVANEGAPVVKQLDELSAEVAASGEALAEVG
jgi:hypothetical protein